MFHGLPWISMAGIGLLSFGCYLARAYRWGMATHPGSVMRWSLSDIYCNSTSSSSAVRILVRAWRSSWRMRSLLTP